MKNNAKASTGTTTTKIIEILGLITIDIMNAKISINGARTAIRITIWNDI